jgi:hypothetical protein
MKDIMPMTLINNFQESIDSQKVKDTEAAFTAKINAETMNTQYCNELITHILESLNTKKGMHGNKCIFTMRSLLYENVISSYYKRHTFEQEQKVCNMLNICFQSHQDLKHFKVRSLNMSYDQFLTNMYAEDDACLGTCTFCLCCPCWFPCYCIPTHLFNVYLGRKIRYEITLDLIHSPPTEMDVSIGIPGAM